MGCCHHGGHGSGYALKIFNLLIIAEKVEETLYAQGLRSGLLANSVSSEQLAYFQSNVSAEYQHVKRLEALGASFPQNEFYYPPDTFDSLKAFLRVALYLENAGIDGYSAAIFQFNRHHVWPRYSLIAARILGVEVAHRVVDRLVAGKCPPNDLCFERVPILSVEKAATVFLPYTKPNQFNGQSTGPICYAHEEEVEKLADCNYCVNPFYADGDEGSWGD